MKNTLIVFLLLLAVGQFAEAQDKIVLRDAAPGSPQISVKDSALRTFLGPNIVSLLSEADSIESFLVDGWTQDKTAGLAGDFKIIRKGGLLNSRQKDQLSEILANKQSHLLDNVSKRCGFQPEVAFRYRKNGQTFTVQLMLSCGVWVFYDSARPAGILSDCEPVVPKLSALTDELFPPEQNSVSAENLGEITDKTGSEPQWHIVKAKESLWSVSRKYGLTLAALRELNNFKNNEAVIHPNQKLLVKK